MKTHKRRERAPESDTSSLRPYVTSAQTYNIKEVEDLILKFFITGNIAFAQAQNPFFRKLIAMINTATGMAKCPSRFTIRRRLREGMNTAVVDTRNQLDKHDGKVSIALDCWSTRTMLPYLGTTPLFVTFNWSQRGLFVHFPHNRAR